MSDTMKNQEIDYLDQFLHPKDRDERIKAARELGKLKGSHALEPMIAYVANYIADLSSIMEKDVDSFTPAGRIEWENRLKFDVEVAWEIIDAFGEIGDEKVSDILILALEFSYLYSFAMKALGKIGGEKAIDALIQKLYGVNMFTHWWDEWRDVPNQALAALKAIGTPAATKMINILNKYDDSHPVIVEALCEIGDPRAIEPILNFMKRNTTEWRGGYELRKLGNFGDLRFFEPIVDRVRDDIFGDQHAADALADLGEPIVERLILLLDDENRDVRECSVRALGKIRDERAVAPLIKRLNDNDTKVVWATKESLKKIGTSEALAALEASKNNHD